MLYEISPADDLWAALAGLAPGDRVLVHAGTYETCAGSCYREVVLKEKRPEGFVGIENLMGSATPKKQTAEEEVGAMGD